MIYEDLPPPRLSRSIQTVEEVAAMSIEELEGSLAAHELEIVSLVGALDGQRVHNAVAARQAERILRLHKSWVERELKARRHARDVESPKLAKKIKAQTHKKALEKAAAERMARIAASNDENVRQIAVFKEVALEVLGSEKYLELWELAKRRMTVAPLPESDMTQARGE